MASYTFPEDDRYVGTYTIFDGDLPLPPPDANKNETVTSSGLLGGEHLLLISGTNTSFGEDVKVRIILSTGERLFMRHSVPEHSLLAPALNIRLNSILWVMLSCWSLSLIIRDNGKMEKLMMVMKRMMMWYLSETIVKARQR